LWQSCFSKAYDSIISIINLMFTVKIKFKNSEKQDLENNFSGGGTIS
jgi:hypothetical protein